MLQNLFPKRITFRHWISVIYAFAFELSFQSIALFSNGPDVLRPSRTFFLAEGPRSIPARRRPRALERVWTLTTSHRVLLGLAAAGGVKPKSPGLRLCSGVATILKHADARCQRGLPFLNLFGRTDAALGIELALYDVQ